MKILALKSHIERSFPTIRLSSRCFTCSRYRARICAYATISTLPCGVPTVNRMCRLARQSLEALRIPFGARRDSPVSHHPSGDRHGAVILLDHFPPSKTRARAGRWSIPCPKSCFSCCAASWPRTRSKRRPDPRRTALVPLFCAADGPAAPARHARPLGDRKPPAPGHGRGILRRLDAPENRRRAGQQAVIRHAALNIFRQIDDTASMKARRKTAAWDDDYLFEAIRKTK